MTHTNPEVRATVDPIVANVETALVELRELDRTLLDLLAGPGQAARSTPTASPGI